MTTETVDPETGEVMTQLVKYDPRAYLQSLTKNDGLAVQRELAAAYDTAVAALIGPNDVQEDKGRTFKKKSAWRKLARYFGISVETVSVVNSTVSDDAGEHFLSTVTARAIAPWGQRYEEVGACCVNEATGRRVISVADAIATASTRASYRAVSNLIAMGEVSAEEIGEREPYGERQPRATNSSNGVPSMPFGKTKGTPLSKMETKDLSSALDWAIEKGKFSDFQQQAREELARRNKPTSGEPEPTDMDQIDGDDGLPF